MNNIVILGAGRVGSLVSCFLVESGDYIVHLVDKSIPKNKPTLEKNIDNLKYVELDVSDAIALKSYIQNNNIKTIVSCLPFFLNKDIAKLACDINLNYFDLTEDVETTNYIKSIANNSKSNFFAPQCGLAPGFISILANDFMQDFDTIDTVRMRVGALPLNVSNALQYALTWSTEGLINEYAKPCKAIVNGEKAILKPLEDIEKININGLVYEAFNTSGGVGSMIDTYYGKVENLNYKTIRYPGHCEKMKFLMQDMKLGEDLETMVKIMENALPHINQDIVLIYVSVDGILNGIKTERNFAQEYPSKFIFGKHFSALQLTTATSLCVSIDILLNSQEKITGFISQESISLKDFYNNRFGSYYKNEGLLTQAY